MSAAEEILLTTCPRDCYDSCGVAVVRRGGEVHAVRGNKAHPISRGTLCGKCSTAYNREWLDPKKRLLRPLRRVTPKDSPGGPAFEAVSWDTALADIAARLKTIGVRHGAASILNAHYTGTLSLLAGTVPMRFFNRLGATEITPDTICNMAGHVALRYTYGSSLDGFDPRTAVDAACILVWGANPHACAPHAHEHWLPESRATVIVIDPVRTPSAARAHHHLQLRPGSDAALAFGFMHVIVRDGLADRAFIDAHVAGWDELERAVMACDLATVSRQSGIAVDRIETAARIYARGPSLLWLGQGLQRQAMGGNLMRACAALPAVTGNLCKPGAGFLYLNWNLAARGIDESYLTAPQLAAAPVPSISHMDLAATLEDPDRSRALIVWNMNPAASCPQQSRLRRALQRKDLFTVALDLFPTDTTALADYVLPAAGFLEFDDLIVSYFHLTLSVQRKVMEPLGQALPNLEIFRRLARAMDFHEPPLHESDAAILARLMAQSGSGETFESLAAKGSVWISTAPLVQFADRRWPTPSGRIELASDAAAADGHPRLPVCHADEPPVDRHLRLLSPADDWLLNSSFGNVGRILDRLGPATIGLHPTDAADRELADGELAIVYNDCGSLELKVTITDAVQPGVALSHKGRWRGGGDPAAAAAGRCEEQGNVNVLNSGAKSDMGESTAVHSVQVLVRRAT